MNLKTSPIRPRLFSLLMILSLLLQAGLPTPALAAQQATPVETGPGLPPGAPFVDCASVTEIPVSECDALLALHAATDGANWITRTGWLETDTPCSWFGVTCTGGFVTALSLYGNNLTDEIAYLALDQERGTRARVGYLTNTPRSLGLTLRLKF